MLQIAALRAEHAALITNQQELEADYRRFAVDDAGMEEEHVVIKIQQARSAPHKSKRLQAIHEAHAAAASKEAELKAAESALQASTSVDTAKAMAKQLQREVCVSPNLDNHQCEYISCVIVLLLTLQNSDSCPRQYMFSNLASLAFASCV